MSSREARKQQYFSRLIGYLNKYNQILIVGADNVGSNQMQSIRRNLRGRAELLMGKNTMIRKAIKGHLEANPGLETLLPYVRGNIGFFFTKGDLKSVRDDILSNKVAAVARVGSLSPCDVFLPAGGTSLDPSQTNFMQALNIATRINRGNIEIINQVHLIKKGEKVGSSEAALLQKLDIKPFFYGLVPLQVYKDGTIFSPDVLDISDDDILAKFTFGVQRVAALSLHIHVPTLAAVPHYFASAYRNLLAISVATDYTFDRAAPIKALLSDPEALARATAAAASASAPAASAAPADTKAEAGATKAAAAPAPKEEEETEEDVGLMDLFG